MIAINALVAVVLFFGLLAILLLAIYPKRSTTLLYPKE